MANLQDIFLRSKTANVIQEYKSIRVLEYKRVRSRINPLARSAKRPLGLRPTSWRGLLGVCGSRERGIGSRRGGAQ